MSPCQSFAKFDLYLEDKRKKWSGGNKKGRPDHTPVEVSPDTHRRNVKERPNIFYYRWAHFQHSFLLLKTGDFLPETLVKSPQTLNFKNYFTL